MTHKETPEKKELLDAEAELRKFQEGIAGLKETEEKSSETADFKIYPEMQLRAFDPSELTFEDMAMYLKMKQKAATPKDWKVYHQNTLRFSEEKGREENSTRIIFDAYLANRMPIE